MMSHATLTLYYHISMLTLHTSIPRRLIVQVHDHQREGIIIYEHSASHSSNIKALKYHVGSHVACFS